VQEVTLGAYARQDLPFEKLLEELQPQREMSYSPLFQVMLVFQNTPRPEIELRELTVSHMAIAGTVWANFDWTLWMWEDGDELRGYVDYNTDLFDAATILRMLEHFRTLLGSIVTDPGGRLSDLSLLPAAERHQLLASWNDTRVPEPAAPGIHRWFEAQVKRSPEAVAVVCDDQRLSYRELNHRANRLAHYLQALGVGPEVLVGLSIARRPEMIVALLGILKTGGAYLPLDPGYPRERLAVMIEDARIPVLVTHSRLIGRDLLSGVPEPPPRVVALAERSEILARESEENPAGAPTADRLAYVIYTSGSTGRPKGVEITHGSLAQFTRAAADAWALQPDDRVLQFASLSFDTAAEEIYPCLTRGATLVLRTDPMLDSVESFLDRCRRWELTVLDLPTAYWHELTATLARRERALPEAVRLVVIGGEKAAPEPLRAWRRCVAADVELLNTYGPTETTVVATTCALSAPAAGGDGSQQVAIGRPIRNVRAYVLDRRLRPVPVGVAGQLLIAGSGVARGYRFHPELSAERFLPDPWSAVPGARLYQTGDLARYLGDGRLEFLGRIDQQVKVRGFRIEPGEIETVLSRHAGVLQSVVVARDDDQEGRTPGGTRLVAYVAAAAPSAPTLSELRSHLAETLPDYMMPSAFVVMPALPLTPSGKVDRRRLPAPERARPELEKAFRAPAGATEEAVAKIFAETTGRDRVGADDDFFELGGHSLLAT
ncbi:MAG: amino acid adenylation domain-containing protein, partial [bacterium]|nr:amino acid adenylation domain-containing protein [bacterium]